MPFPQDEAKLVSIFIQTLLYGAYTVVFALTLWVLIYQRPAGQNINRMMLGISLTMFILATMHIGVNYTRIIKAFITFRDEPGGPAAYFNLLSNFTQIFGSTIYVAQTLVGDSVVLMRCYFVWGRQLYIVAFPALLLLGSTVSGIGILYSFARIVPQAEVFVAELQQWIISFFSLTLATNIICTTLVAARIWYINRSVMVFTQRSWNPVILLVIESGSIYSATLLALLILYKTESWFQYVLLDAISPIVGLVFSMIIVRIGLGITSPTGETRNYPGRHAPGATSTTTTTIRFSTRGREQDSRGSRSTKTTSNTHKIDPFVSRGRVETSITTRTEDEDLEMQSMGMGMDEQDHDASHPHSQAQSVNLDKVKVPHEEEE